MKLSIGAILLAVFALAAAAPYGHQKKLQRFDLPMMRQAPRKIDVSTTKAYSGYNLPTTTLAQDLPLTTVNNDQAEFDCSGKDDGAYASPQGCAPEYYLCWKDITTKAVCPENMFFNIDNSGCDFHEIVFACSGVSTTTPLADEPSTLKPIDFDCSQLADGDYPWTEECKQTYVSCVGGAGIERTCPDELMFDPEERLCERKENIIACGGSPTTTMMPPHMDIKFECPAPSSSFPIESQLCSATYYTCDENGVPSIGMCDEPMIWNDKTKACANPQDIPECMFDCSDKEDAMYGEGCSNNYWWCWQGRATKLSCPNDMFFDSAAGLCNFQHNVFDCTGVSTTTMINDLPASTLKPVDFDCSGKEDGQYAMNGESCQPTFVQCVGGSAWSMDCPAGLHFDPENLFCEELVHIVACGGSPRTTPLPQSDVSIEKADNYGSYSKAPLTQDIPAKKIDNYGSYSKAPVAQDLPKKHHSKKFFKHDITTTTKAYGQKHHLKAKKIMTTMAPIEDLPETTLGYDQDAYGGFSTVQLDLTTQQVDSYGNILTTPLPKKIFTTTKALPKKIETPKAYGYSTLPQKVFTTTLPKKIETTTGSYYGNILTSTPLIDIETTTDSYTTALPLTTRVHKLKPKHHHKKQILTTTQAYGGYQTTTPLPVKIETTTSQAYGGYQKLTTLPEKVFTTALPKKIETPKAYGYSTLPQKVFTTTRLPKKILTTTADSYYGNILTSTPLVDIETTTDSYTTLPLTTREHKLKHHHKKQFLTTTTQGY